MSELAIGIIGTGDPNGDGTAMAYAHADAYRRHDGCEVVACADLVRSNAERFAGAYDLKSDRIYEDYIEMLAEEDLDIVSVCTPVPTHEEIVVSCATTGHVQGIHCEKPMADTWGGALKMATACRDHDVQLTFNHQRRFGLPWRRAKELLDAGEIGNLERLETSPGPLLDSGTHRIDCCHFFADDSDVEWVMGGIDYRTENVRFGAHNENQAIGIWEYDNGVFGLAISDQSGVGRGAVDCFTRLIGSDGIIEVGRHNDDPLRLHAYDSPGWETIDCGGEGVNEAVNIDRAIAAVVTGLEDGSEPEIGATNALSVTEVIYGLWESARRRGRVNFPLEIDDNPLESMINAGKLSPSSPD